MNIILELLSTIIYLLRLTFETEALWIVLPLAISTFLIVIYFGVYSEEESGWNTHLSNSFVLLFVSIALLRHIYLLEGGEAFNFIHYWGRTVIVLSLLTLGMILVRFNFGHVLPEKYAKYLSSPVTVNFIAYVVILLVFSKIEFSWIILLASIIIVLVLMGILCIVRLPLKKIRRSLEKEKTRERVKNIKESKFQIGEIKRNLKTREKGLKDLEFHEIQKKKAEAIKLGNILKKK